MAVNSVHFARVSNNLRVLNVLESLRRTSNDLLAQQTRLATGRNFITPSDDPIASGQAMALHSLLNRQDQIESNLNYANSFLAATDAALFDVNDLINEASSIASQNLGALAGSEEREAAAEVVAAILDQLIDVGNRQFSGRYLFAGRDTTEAPFVEALGGVAYLGDTGNLLAQVNDLQQEAVNMPGDLTFSALSDPIGGAIDLNPALTDDTRLEDLNGARGLGVMPGVLIFMEANGAGRFEVDLSEADTIGDLVSLINGRAAEVGSSTTASVTLTGITITPGTGTLTIDDSSGGFIAADLGILTETPVTQPIVGLDLDPRLTAVTRIVNLNGGLGLDLSAGLVVTNGTASATLDFSQATTIQDVLNEFNNAGVYVLARVNAAGTAIEVLNQVSGSALSIGENGGSAATDLGIRTFSGTTPLADLQEAHDWSDAPGEVDFQITAKDGTPIYVSLHGLQTVDEVLAAINAASAAAGASVTASLNPMGNGIRLQDTGGGTGPLSIISMNGSFASKDLGLEGSVADPATELVGSDMHLMDVESVFAALVDLEAALRNDDADAMTDAGERLAEFSTKLTTARGIIGARAKAMQDRLGRAESTEFSTLENLARVEGLDYAEAITVFQQAQTAMQANLLTSSQLLNLSLMDYLA